MSAGMGPMQRRLIHHLLGGPAAGVTLRRVAGELGWGYRQAESAMSKLKKRGLVTETGRDGEAKKWKVL